MSHLLLYSSLTAAINFLFCGLGVYLITRLPRRTLLLASLATVLVSLLAISLSFQFVESYANSSLGSVLALVSLCVYLAGFSPGLGTLPWVINR